MVSRSSKREEQNIALVVPGGPAATILGVCPPQICEIMTPIDPAFAAATLHSRLFLRRATGQLLPLQTPIYGRDPFPLKMAQARKRNVSPEQAA